MRLWSVALVAALTASAMPNVWAGEIAGNRYVAQRYGKFEVEAPAGQWVILDRESNGDNTYGGPVVDFKSTRAAGSIYPVVMVSAFKRAAEDITPDFLLRTSRDAMQQRGAEPGPVLVRTVNNRKVRYFDARVQQHGKPAQLYYVLLEGAETLFAAQMVAPEGDFEAARRQVDELLTRARY